MKIRKQQFSSVAQSYPTLSEPMIAAQQASLPITNSQSSLKLTSIESVMPSSHLLLCRPLLLLPSIFPSIRVFFKESVLCTKWPKYWSFTFSIIPSNESAQFSSVLFIHSVVSDSLRPHESHQARPPCPSPTPRVHSNSHPSSL